MHKWRRKGAATGNGGCFRHAGEKTVLIRRNKRRGGGFGRTARRFKRRQSRPGLRRLQFAMDLVRRQGQRHDFAGSRRNGHGRSVRVVRRFPVFGREHPHDGPRRQSRSTWLLHCARQRFKSRKNEEQRRSSLGFAWVTVPALLWPTTRCTSSVPATEVFAFDRQSTG
jgi:hypothetical protein